MILSLIIWIPIATALFLLLAPADNGRLARNLALLPMIVVLALSLFVFAAAAPIDSPYKFQIQRPWIESLGISYHLGVDQVSALLVLLTALVGTSAILVSNVTENARYYYGLGLLMIGGMAGAFASVDLFFMYVFHEFALIPTFLLVGIWGGEQRKAAAIKMTLYLALASLVLLLGLIGLCFASRPGSPTFDLVELGRRAGAQGWLNQPGEQARIFGLLFLGFGTLVAVVPFHTWAPMGYGEAPPLAAMLHAGVIKKFGLYGLYRVAVPLLPGGFKETLFKLSLPHLPTVAVTWQEIIVVLAVGNLVYGGYVAMQQRDLRYMLGYSSVSHMGYAFLALAADNAIATQGFILFLFAHGLSASLGFAIAGHLREQTGTGWIAALGGLATRMPFLAAMFTMTALAGFGLPGFANFPAELTIFLGSFEAYPVATTLAVWTTVISAVYLLRAVRAVFLGPLNEKWVSTGDASMRKKVALGVLIAALFVGGFCPRAIIGSSSGTASTSFGEIRVPAPRSEAHNQASCSRDLPQPH
jgi:NADH-quinone oxidoreductase subunit M